jgi:hypothetical protein
MRLCQCVILAQYVFLLREIVIGVSSVMVSWLMTYGAAAKLRASCECAHRIVLLVGCWYQGLWSWSIVELHWCVISVNYFLETISMLFVKWSSNIYHLCWIKRAYPFNVWSLVPLLWWWLRTYKFPLRPLCKGEALELFSVERQLISSQNGDLFPLLLRCRSLFIRSLI